MGAHIAYSETGSTCIGLDAISPYRRRTCLDQLPAGPTTYCLLHRACWRSRFWFQQSNRRGDRDGASLRPSLPYARFFLARIPTR